MSISGKKKRPPNLYLVGFMGSGKTTVGKILARALGRGFYDSDRWVESAAGLKIREIFAVSGEAAFRKLETTAVRALSNKTAAVIALGGGSLIRSENRRITRKTGLRIYLQAKPETICDRVRKQATTRPLLAGQSAADLAKNVRRLLKQRTEFYRIAEITVRVDGKKPREVARSILRKLPPHE